MARGKRTAVIGFEVFLPIEMRVWRKEVLPALGREHRRKMGL